jgi:ankyrin repeat protein
VLKKGISFKLIDNQKKSCLHYAAESGNITLVQALLEEGLDINSTDKNGDTPLSLLVKNNYHKLVEFVELGSKHKLDINK